MTPTPRSAAPTWRNAELAAENAALRRRLDRAEGRWGLKDQSLLVARLRDVLASGKPLRRSYGGTLRWWARALLEAAVLEWEVGLLDFPVLWWLLRGLGVAHHVWAEDEV